jgi:hypothetical protein
MNLIRSLDMFGTSIGLNYKENSVHKTNLGAFITFFCVFTLGHYTYLQLRELSSRANPTLTYTETTLNLFNGNNTFNLNENSY